MASVSFSLPRNSGDRSVALTTGTLAPSAGAIQLRIDNAAGLRKQDVIQALDRFKAAILENATLIA